MSSFMKFINSSIGKKLTMAVTGSFLLIFLVIHLIGNITLFFGAQAFNGYVSALDVIKPLIRVIEVVLLSAFVLHIFNGVKLWLENKRARGVNYKVNGSSENSDLYSRTMFLSGSIVFIFLVSHLGTFFWRFNVHDPMGLANVHQYFDIVVYFFGIWCYVILYVIAMVLREFSIRVPAVPSEKLLPNSTAHYLTKSKLKGVLRRGAANAVPDALRQELEEMRAGDTRPVKLAGTWPYDLTVEVVWPKGRRKPDLDGALSSCKSLLDGIADAIGIDDRHCQQITVRQRRAGKNERGAVIATYSLHDL